MRANADYKKMPRNFWAYVRTISQGYGYTERKTRQVKIPNIENIKEIFKKLNLDYSDIVSDSDSLTSFGEKLLGYFDHRAMILNSYVEPRLMNRDRAANEFNKLRSQLNPSCPLPMNKQKGEKKAFAYFTCIINMLIENSIGKNCCNYDPGELTTITSNGKPLRTLSRRVDGAFPSAVNPVAIWEIKEYYYTTTFGSRVADGVYETLLDGMELSELAEHENKQVAHYLMIDDYFTWWGCGKSYLCRIIDMLHMGYVDEVLFGYEVVERLPDIALEWIKTDNRKTATG